jgi:hypothetical protein
MQHALVGVVALATACVGVVAGCGSRPPVARATTPTVRGPDVSGTWDWDVEERNDEGDTRVEREVWHLTQRGGEIQGYYDRVLTVLSGDGRPFECYQNTRYQKFTRFRILGSIEGAMVRLRETSYETRPDPCDGGRRSMTAYVGRMEGGTITLRWPPAGQQVLRRRNEGTAAASPEDTTASVTRAALPPTASVGGLWLWEWRAIDANGDERSAREEWHLKQREGRVHGVVDRTVRLVSGSGAPFPCSGKPEKTIVMRYQVSGQVTGRRVEITELAHSQLAGAPCRLDATPLASHEGEVGVEEMVLSSARAAGERHVLRRLRPETGGP